MRVFLIVIDSFGIGEMPDAAKFGDVGSDTYGNICREVGVSLPVLVSLGLNNIDGVAKRYPNGKEILPCRTRAPHMEGCRKDIRQGYHRRALRNRRTSAGASVSDL